MRQQPKLHTLLKMKAFVRIPSYFLLSNLNLDIAKVIGCNNKNLIKNKDIKIELNRNINKAEVYHNKSTQSLSQK